MFIVGFLESTPKFIYFSEVKRRILIIQRGDPDSHICHLTIFLAAMMMAPFIFKAYTQGVVLVIISALMILSVILYTKTF